jgi:hypothetical protein
METDRPSAERARLFRHRAYAVAAVLAPALLVPGTLFNPAVGGVGAGAANIAANAAADSATNQLHIAIYVVETFLLPLGILGMVALAFPRSPWLATIGGGLGLAGWLPWSALAAQDDLTFRIAQTGGGSEFVQLWNRFTTDWAMGILTLVYVLAHLAAFVILAVALRRAGAIPGWSVWALGLTSPVTILAFPTHEQRLLYVVAALWIAGSVPVSLRLWRGGEGSAYPGSPAGASSPAGSASLAGSASPAGSGSDGRSVG